MRKLTRLIYYVVSHNQLISGCLFDASIMPDDSFLVLQSGEGTVVVLASL